MGRMYPLDPKPDDMRAMGEAAVEFLIGFIHGLDDAPLSNVQGSIELARSLRAPLVPCRFCTVRVKPSPTAANLMR